MYRAATYKQKNVQGSVSRLACYFELNGMVICGRLSRIYPVPLAAV